MGLQSKLFAGDLKLEAAATSDPAHIVQGAAGEHVEKIQQALIELDGANIDPGEKKISRYGPSTAKAVLDYKRKRNIVNRNYQTTADDIVGRMTMASLDKEMLHHQHLHMKLEIEGPFLPYPQRVSSQRMFQFAVASGASSTLAQPRRPSSPPHAHPHAPPDFPITDTPNMPPISFRCNVRGAAPEVVARTAFHWELTVNFSALHCRHGPNRNISKTHREIVTGDNFIPFFPFIRGGHFTAACSCTIGGKRLHDKLSIGSIGATNPLRNHVFAALPHKTLRQICQLESGVRQFDAAPEGGVSKCPLWSGDGLGGVGLFQITIPKPTDDEVWNWRSNVAGAIRLFNAHMEYCRGYPARVRNSHRFRQLVDEWRRHNKKDTGFQIHLPEFTTGDFDSNLQQLELDTIRAFNGFGGGSDGFLSRREGGFQHEFQVALDGHGGLKVHNFEGDGPSAMAMWERRNWRTRTSGDPDYVNDVQKQNL